MTQSMMPQHFDPWRASMSLGVRQLVVWWRRELSVFLPHKIVEWLTGKRGLSLVITSTNAFVDIELVRRPHHILDGARVNADDFSYVDIEKFMQKHNIDDTEIDVGLRLPDEKIFRRNVVLPIQAERDLDRIAIHDLITKTPFRLDDVYIGSVYSRADQQHTLIVTQWLVLRSIIAEFASRLEISSDKVRFVVDSGKENGIAAFIPLRSAEPTTPRRFGAIVQSLTASALLLGVVAASVEYASQQSVIDALDARISTTRVAVGRIEAIVDKIKQRRSIIAHLQELKFQEARALDIWEEISTILPTHSWLTELHISMSPNSEVREISMHGLSTSASTLVALVDKSSLFFDAALTAPVVVNQQINREIFLLHAYIAKYKDRSRAAQ